MFTTWQGCLLGALCSPATKRMCGWVVKNGHHVCARPWAGEWRGRVEAGTTRSSSTGARAPLSPSRVCCATSCLASSGRFLRSSTDRPMSFRNLVIAASVGLWDQSEGVAAGGEDSSGGRDLWCVTLRSTGCPGADKCCLYKSNGILKALRYGMQGCCC